MPPRRTAGSGIEHFDALAGEFVHPPGGGVLLGERTAYPGVGALVGVAPRQRVTVDAVGSQLVGGQIHPAALQILVDISQKVGELERFSQRGGVRCSLLAGADGAENGQHLQSDHLGRPVHVPLESLAVRVVRDRQVHPHRREEVVEHLPWDAVPAGGVDDGAQRGVVTGVLMLDKLIEQLRGQPLEPFCSLLGVQGGVEVVEDVVGATREPVQRMDRRALLGREQPGGEEERPAVLGVEHPALPIGVAQGRIVHPGGVEFGSDHACPPPM